MHRRWILPVSVGLLALCYATQPHDTADFLKTVFFSVFLFLSSCVTLGFAAGRAVLLVFTIPLTFTSSPTQIYSGKVMAILGASSGIGKDLALIAAQKGATLVLVARRIDKLNEVAQQCRELGSPRVDVFPTDVSLAEQTQLLMDSIQEDHGRLDVLILNAAVPGSITAVEKIQNISTLRQLMDINFWGYVIPTYQALPLLKQSQGHIVVVSSIYGKVIAPFQAGYAATKHAIHGFFDGLRQELRSCGVGITVHCPGGIETEILQKFQLGDGHKMELKLPWIFLAPSRDCAMDILRAYDERKELVFYPAYSAGLSFFRGVFPVEFDYAFFWLTNFYYETGILETVPAA